MEFLPCCPLFTLQVLTCEAVMQTEVKPTLWKSLRARALRGRPSSLINNYFDTSPKQLVAWILESSCSMSPAIYKLVENTKSVLRSDEKLQRLSPVPPSLTMSFHSLFLKVMPPAWQGMSLSAHVPPFQGHPGLLHPESCGDLCAFTAGEDQVEEWRIQRAEHKQPNSFIVVLSGKLYFDLVSACL
ncbi:LOW QUALITY PROTEIN: endosomal transmembrane epsin interactor 1 [Porphyrio hochstetteri]